MKVLILSCNTGQGHNSAALAVYENLKSHQVDCKFMDALLFAGKRTSDAVSKTYVNVAGKAPHIFGLAYRAGGFISNTKTKSPVYFANSRYARQMYHYITGNHYDAVITSHLFPAQTLTYIKNKYGLDILTLAIATDYTSIPFWEETCLDYYILGHPDLTAEFHKKGIPKEKLLPLGIPVSSQFLTKLPKEKARMRTRLPADHFVVMMMSGSMGFGRLSPLICSFLKQGDKITVVVMCGTNQKLKTSLEEKFDSSQVCALGFTNQVSLYMDSADLLYTKPGGLTSTEALIKNIPFIHTAPIPGCETKNARFFASRGMSYTSRSVEEQVSYGTLLFKNTSARNAMLQAQKENAFPHAAEDIYQLLRSKL